METYFDIIFVTSFGWRNGNNVESLKFDFVTISLKNYNLVKSRNFLLTIIENYGTMGAVSPQCPLAAILPSW